MAGKMKGVLGGLRRKHLPVVRDELLLSIGYALLRSYSDTVNGRPSALTDDEASDITAGCEALEQLVRKRQPLPSQALLPFSGDDDAEAT